MNLSMEDRTFTMSCEIRGTTYFLVKKLPSEQLFVNHIFAIVFNSVLVISTISLNAAASMTIYKSSQLYNKTCYFIILVQSAIDLAVGFVSIPFFLMYLVSGIEGTSKCILVNVILKIIFLPCALSAVTLCALTIERYIAILHPYRYNVQVTRKRLLAFIGFGAIIMSSAFVSYFFIPMLLLGFGRAVDVSVLSFTAFAYTRIYLVARKSAHPPNKLPSDANSENLTRIKLFLRRTRQARSCFNIVLCYFVLCFLLWTLGLSFTKAFDMYTRNAIFIWVSTLNLLNSSLNSVLLFWSQALLRREAIKMLKRFTTKNKQ